MQWHILYAHHYHYDRNIAGNMAQGMCVRVWRVLIHPHIISSMWFMRDRVIGVKGDLCNRRGNRQAEHVKTQGPCYPRMHSAEPFHAKFTPTVIHFASLHQTQQALALAHNAHMHYTIYQHLMVRTTTKEKLDSFIFS